MKKIFVLLVAIVTVFLTGCGKEQYLECSTTQTESGMELDSKIIAKFEGIEATHMDMEINVKVDEEYLSYVSIETLKDALKTTYDEQYGKDGIKINYTTGENNVLVNLEFDLKNISAEDKKELDLVDVYGTIEATKEEMEKEGYTCTIK